MQSLDPKVIVLFFAKNFLGSVYILPLWFIAVAIFEHAWSGSIGILSEDVVVLLLDGAGCIFLAMLVAISYFWAWLTYNGFAYELQHDGIHINKGVIIKRHSIITYADIESVDILVNPVVTRFLNLFTIQIKTRDIENSEGIFKKKQMQLIPGLTAETVRSLRPELFKNSHIQKARQTRFDPVSGRYI